ncbi:MAG: peptidoglycan DD-metalloendopeptidase family protein [Bacteroidales bacterium]|nr:peptidoglycan DD-metalloendopeptidase family protein [Bacteroidales bacterium]
MKKYFICLILIGLSLACYPQKSKAKLEKQITKLEQEIATANKLLKETSKNKQATLNQVNILDKKIKQREELVKAYNEQISVLDEEINKGQSNIKSLNKDLKNLRQEYAQMIVFANKNRSHYDKLVFLFSADDFNQAFRRLRYIRQFSDARKTKMDQIASTERRISGEVEASRKAREQQTALLTSEREQQAALQNEKSELNTQVQELKKREGSLQQDIKSKQQQAKKVQKAIDDIIAEEIRKANERARKEAEARAKAEAEAKKNNKGNASSSSASAGSSSKTMALTPSEKTLSNNFANNKGKLPWPVEKGYVSSSYGKHASVVSDKVVVTNNGIDIAVSENSQARAVFDGMVVSVNKLTATNTVIIIRHGDYFSVYSNIETPAVKRGDNVKTKQNLGKIHTNLTEGKTELHFELLKEKDRLNPESWLAK